MTARPNIMLVVAEDMGPQLGAYGCTDARTPRLDAFARNAIRFDTAWCSYPVCSPGRSSLLTGLPPHENGTMGLATCGFTTFEGVPSLPTLLASEGGYRTGRIGKLHVLPESRFDTEFKWADRKRFSFMGRDYVKMLRFADEFIADDLSPFFLYVALPDAHVPFLQQSFGEPADPIAPEDVGVVPGMDRKLAEWRHWYAAYHNCIQRVDLAFGGLMDILDRRGLRDDTLVIVTSDHGLQFPRGKLSLYEPGLRIPMLVGGAGVTQGGAQSGATVSTPVSGVDVFNTIVSAAGLTPPSPADARGRSLIDLAGDANDDHRCIFGEITACMPNTYFPQRAMRDQRYKLIWTLRADTEDPSYRALMDGFSSPGEYAPPDPPDARGRPPIPPSASLSPAIRQAYETWRQPPTYQLYDLDADPLEAVNRAGDPALAQVERRLRERLEQWMRDTDDFILDEQRRSDFEVEIETYVQQVPPGSKRRLFDWAYPKRWRPRTLWPSVSSHLPGSPT